MYEFALCVLLLLLAISASVESQSQCRQFCSPIGAQCIVHDQCASTYCDLYSRADENEYGNCAIPPPNWGHCKFESEDCTSNEECCTGNCYTLVQYNISYCNPPIRSPTPPIVLADVPSPSLALTPATTTTPTPTPTTTPVTSPSSTPTLNPAPAPTDSKKKHKNRKLKHSKSHGKRGFAPAPC